MRASCPADRTQDAVQKRYFVDVPTLKAHLMRLVVAATLVLIAVPWQLPAQELPLRPGDTVRVWQSGALQPQPSGIVTQLSGDTLVFDQGRLRVTELARIDVARGTTMHRPRLVRYLVTGAVVGLGTGLLVNDRIVCRGCDTITDFVGTGAAVGAGIAYLIARTRVTVPRWHTIWPMDSLVLRPVASRPDTTVVLTAAAIADVRSGDEMRIWQTDSLVRLGQFDRITPDGSGLLLRGRDTPVRLTSIDALEVGRRRTTEGALFGTAIVGLPMLLLGSLACGLSSDDCGDEVLGVAAVSAAIGFGAGALVGHSRIRWRVRFSR
jgi:hypothetical protein